jgi:medium-chain acyl-[acyl-carrier-protein] hydrolase
MNEKDIVLCDKIGGYKKHHPSEAALERKTIWFTETTVKTYETDFQGNWKPAAFVQAMIEAATEHAAHLGFDYPSLLAKDMVWVLSRFKIQITAYPTVGDKIILKTWPKGLQQKLFFMRDFELRSPQGQPLAVASFAWLVMSPKARRMLAPQAILQGFGTDVPDNGGLSALDEPLDKINPPDGLPERFIAAAQYSTVDMLGHANAARYVEWVCDCFSQEEYRQRPLAWLQLNYVNETRPGERLAIAAGPDGPGGRWYVQGTNLNTGLKSFEAAVGWK